MSGTVSLDSGTVDQTRRTQHTLSEGRVGWVDPRVREGGGGIGGFGRLGITPQFSPPPPSFLRRHTTVRAKFLRCPV